MIQPGRAASGWDELRRMAVPSPRVASRSLQPRHAVRALRRALVFIAIAIGVVVITAGFIMWAVDRKNFPDPGEGMWWAVQTVTTIGYGDVVPTTAAGRAVASLVMILGVAFVSILTAFIVSDLVARHAALQQKEIEQEELDTTAAIARLDERLDERLARIEGALGAGPPQEPRSPST